MRTERERDRTRPVRPSDQKKRTERPPVQQQPNFGSPQSTPDNNFGSPSQQNSTNNFGFQTRQAQKMSPAMTVEDEDNLKRAQQLHLHGKSNVNEDLEVDYDEDFEVASDEEVYIPSKQVKQVNTVTGQTLTSGVTQTVGSHFGAGPGPSSNMTQSNIPNFSTSNFQAGTGLPGPGGPQLQTGVPNFGNPNNSLQQQQQQSQSNTFGPGATSSAGGTGAGIGLRSAVIPGSGGINKTTVTPAASDIKKAMEAEKKMAQEKANQNLVALEKQSQTSQHLSGQKWSKDKLGLGGPLQDSNSRGGPSPQPEVQEKQVANPKFDLGEFKSERDMSPKSNVVVHNLGIVSGTKFTNTVHMTHSDQEKQQKRVQEIKKILGKRVMSIETAVVYSQRPQRDLELFLSGRGPFSSKITRGVQTGGECVDEGQQTEQPDTNNKETQAPPLTLGGKSDNLNIGTQTINSMGQTSVSSSDKSDQTRLLPFLRRVLPLMETTLSNSKVARALRKRNQAGNKGGTEDLGNQQIPYVINSFGLDFGSPEALCLVSNYLGRPHLLVLYGMSEEASRYGSIIGLYSIDSLKRGVHPDRLFYSYERITCLDYSSTTASIVCGTFAGSLILFDLRRVQSPAPTAGAQGNPLHRVHGFSGKSSATRGKSFSEQISVSDSEMASIATMDTLSVEGAPVSFAEEPPAYTTDIFALTNNQNSSVTGNNKNQNFAQNYQTQSLFGSPSDDDLMLPPFLSEISDVSVLAGSSQVVALDVQGIVTSWRILQTDSTSLNLQYMHFSIDSSGPLATNLRRIPQEVCGNVGNYVVLSGLGVAPHCSIGESMSQQVQMRDSNGNYVNNNNDGFDFQDKFQSSVRGGGAVHLGLNSNNTQQKISNTSNSMSLAGRFESDSCNGSPTDLAFHPMFPSLLAVAYSSGEVALYDSGLTVPLLTLSAGVRSQTLTQQTTESNQSNFKPSFLGGPMRLSLQWSTTRPTVLYVLAGSELQVWDLAQTVLHPSVRTDVKKSVSEFKNANNNNGPGNKNNLKGQQLQGYDATTSADISPISLDNFSGNKPLSLPPIMLMAPAESLAGSTLGLCFIILNSKTHVLQLPTVYTKPLTAYPSENPLLQQNKHFDSRYNLFDRLKENLSIMQKIIENKATKLEIDILHKVLLMNQ